MRVFITIVTAAIVWFEPVTAQQTLEPAAFSIPPAAIPLMCKQLPTGPADSAALGYLFGVMDDSLPRAIAATYDTAGNSQAIGVTAEISSVGELPLMQHVRARFITADSVVVTVMYIDGAASAADAAHKPEPQPLQLPADLRDALRALGRWAWERRCNRR